MSGILKRQCSLSLTALCALMLGGQCDPVMADQAEGRGDRFPPFCWDTVPRALAVHKPTPWVDEDYARIARHDFLQIAVTEKDLALAAEVKKFNSRITILGYKNLVLHVQGMADPLFHNHPDWFLYTQGKPEVNGRGRNSRPLYDLRKPEIREYWIRDVSRILDIPILDGIFFDAYAKAVNYLPVQRATGQDPQTDYIAGYHAMMEEHLKRSGNTRKIRIGNYLRADKNETAIPEVMKYLDGSYLEGFDHFPALPPGIHSYEEYLAAGMQAVQQVAQAGKIIVLHLSAQNDKDIKLAADGIEEAGASPGVYHNFEYKLAIFLICAERHSYFQYQADPRVAGDAQSWAPDFPEFRKPLGAPKGPAVKQGFTYTREFEHASVWLDLTKRQGRITWKASYLEAKVLTPRHGSDQVPTNAFQCRIEFDRPVKKGSGTISLYRLGDRKKLASVPVESDAVTEQDGRVVVIQFPVQLKDKTRYSITVEKGAFGDRDGLKFLGFPMLGEWMFTTR